MKICVVQVRSVMGDIQHNIARHKELLVLAISKHAEVIVFPELSITGYVEPPLAGPLATTKDDNRFAVFQEISDEHRVTIGIGVPIKTTTLPHISMLIFQPGKARELYFKKHLHADEIPFFSSGENYTGLIIGATNIALAICYELTIPEHSIAAHKAGASVYLASVAKTPKGVEAAEKTLSAIASDYSMTVLMANCVGECEGKMAGGKTSIWNDKGILSGQLNDTNEGILVIDTGTKEIVEHLL